MTPHFTLAEFTRSDIATRLGIDNTLPAALMPAALNTLQMFERIRAFLSAEAGRDVAMIVRSGYRCGAVNWIARRPNQGPGFDDTGDHPKAGAGDWIAPSFGTPTEICRALAPNVDRLGIGQLINEFPDANGWVHTSSIMVSRPINRILTITHAGTVPGIHGG